MIVIIDVRIPVIMPKKIDNEAVYQGVVDRLIERGYAGATTKPIAALAGSSEVRLFRT